MPNNTQTAQSAQTQQTHAPQIQTEAQTWQTTENAQARKKAIIQSVRKYMNVIVKQNSPIEVILASAQFYDCITTALSATKTGAIICRFAGMKESALIRSEQINADVVKNFYPLVKAEQKNAHFATLTEKGVKMQKYAFEYLPATDAQINTQREKEKAEREQ